VAEKNSVTITERLTLYRRSHSERWQARVKLNTGECHRFSTGAADFEKAKESANRELHNVLYGSQVRETWLIKSDRRSNNPGNSQVKPVKH